MKCDIITFFPIEISHCFDPSALPTKLCTGQLFLEDTFFIVRLKNCAKETLYDSVARDINFLAYSLNEIKATFILKLAELTGSFEKYPKNCHTNRLKNCPKRLPEKWPLPQNRKISKLELKGPNDDRYFYTKALWK